MSESIVRSSYPHQVGEPKDLEDNFKQSETPSYADLTRANKLSNVPIGSGHDNFLKGIIVQFDLQYPEYFSPQLQRYNWIDIISSQSKMHKLTSRELTKKDFTENTSKEAIGMVNNYIKIYKEVTNKEDKRHYFNVILSNLPSGYLKWMGISTNYLQLKTMYAQRRHHKLQEWQEFCDWIETLPMSYLITRKK